MLSFNNYQDYDEKFYKIFNVNLKKNWYEMLRKVKDYIDKNEKKPSSSDRDPEIKALGRWLIQQQQKYSSRKKIMNLSDIRLSWEKFFEEYSKYFKTNKDNWYITLEKVKCYINENHKRPSNKDEDPGVRKLGQWLSNQQYNYSSQTNIMVDIKIREFWENFLKETDLFKSNVEHWYKTLEDVKNYIKQYKKTPSTQDKDPDVKFLGRWISNQQSNYKSRDYIMKIPEVQESWTKFIEETDVLSSHVEKWYRSLEKAKNYIKQYKKRPSKTDQNPETRQIGEWISHQQHKYLCQKEIMSDVNIRESWIEFTKENSEYFKSNEKAWYETLAEVKAYIDENNKSPSNIDTNSKIRKLARWISYQHKNYLFQNRIMKNEQIRKSWEEFVEKYNTQINKYKKRRHFYVENICHKKIKS